MVISDHAKKRMLEGGATEEEIKEVLETGTDALAKYGKKAREKVLWFNQLRKGKFYQQKKIQVIYTEEAGEQAVITVFAFYGRWEGQG